MRKMGLEELFCAPVYVAGSVEHVLSNLTLMDDDFQHIFFIIIGATPNSLCK